MIYILSLLIFISFSYNQDNSELIEVSFGRNNPTGEFGERYANDGFSLKVSYSNAFENNKLLKYQFSGQYIHFGTNYYQDQLLLESGMSGPTLDVRNREQAYLVTAGLRFSSYKKIFSTGIIRPYIGASVGLAYFSEKIVWDYSNNTWAQYDCSGAEILLSILFQDNWCSENRNYFEDKIHSNIEPVFTLDLGSNLFFKENQKIGVDFGVRYNMVTGLKKPDIVYYETDTNNGIVSNANSYIIDKLNVDYFTVYLGFSFKLDPKRKDKRNSRKKYKGRHI